MALTIEEIEEKNQEWIAEATPTNKVLHARHAEINQDILDYLKEGVGGIQMNDDFITIPTI